MRALGLATGRKGWIGCDTLIARVQVEFDMTYPHLDAFRQILEGTQKARAEMGEGAEKILDALLRRQVDLEKTKTRINDDIKRGSRLSRGKIPR